MQAIARPTPQPRQADAQMTEEGPIALTMETAMETAAALGTGPRYLLHLGAVTRGRKESRTKTEQAREGQTKKSILLLNLPLHSTLSTRHITQTYDSSMKKKETVSHMVRRQHLVASADQCRRRECTDFSPLLSEQFPVLYVISAASLSCFDFLGAILSMFSRAHILF